MSGLQDRTQESLIKWIQCYEGKIEAKGKAVQVKDELVKDNDRLVKENEKALREYFGKRKG